MEPETEAQEPQEPQEVQEPQEAQEALSPKRGPGPRKEDPRLPKRGPGRPRKEASPDPKLPKPEPLTFDPVVELTRLIRQRNEEQARQRKTAYANMLGL